MRCHNDTLEGGEEKNNGGLAGLTFHMSEKTPSYPHSALDTNRKQIHCPKHHSQLGTKKQMATLKGTQ